MLFIHNDVVAELLSMPDCIAAQERAFRDLAEGRAVHRPRSDIYAPCARDDGYYRWGSMEGAIEPWGIFCTRMKSDIVTWTAQGTDELHCVQPGTFSGFIMIFSSRNGEPLAMINDGVLQHLRVGGGAGLGVKYLARKNAKSVGFLGSGGMARTYLHAFCAVRGIERVKVYSPPKANPQRYALATAGAPRFAVAVAR